jgi:hypothetical protein
VDEMLSAASFLSLSTTGRGSFLIRYSIVSNVQGIVVASDADEWVDDRMLQIANCDQ